jgi:hypothetical protein
MLKKLATRCVVLWASIAIAGSAFHLSAQTNEPAPPVKETAPAKKEKSSKKPRTVPFHGKLKALDKSAKTLTVGSRVFHVTSETRIYKEGTPGSMQDGVLGEPVSGSYEKGPDGKLIAASIYFGGKRGQKTKTQESAPKKKGKKTASEQ